MYSFISRFFTDVSSTCRWLQDLGTFALMHNGVCRHNGKDEGKSGDLRSGEELALSGDGSKPIITTSYHIMTIVGGIKNNIYPIASCFRVGSQAFDAQPMFF
jgi:hypothetical protein